jgi:hypothetical protein
MPADSLVRQAALWNQEGIWKKVMPINRSVSVLTAAQNFKERFKQNVTFIY